MAGKAVSSVLSLGGLKGWSEAERLPVAVNLQVWGWRPTTSRQPLRAPDPMAGFTPSDPMTPCVILVQPFQPAVLSDTVNSRFRAREIVPLTLCCVTLRMAWLRQVVFDKEVVGGPLDAVVVR